jgi:hypothetical protein
MTAGKYSRFQAGAPRKRGYPPRVGKEGLTNTGLGDVAEPSRCAPARSPLWAATAGRVASLTPRGPLGRLAPTFYLRLHPRGRAVPTACVGRDEGARRRDCFGSFGLGFRAASRLYPGSALRKSARGWLIALMVMCCDPLGHTADGRVVEPQRL